MISCGPDLWQEWPGDSAASVRSIRNGTDVDTVCRLDAAGPEYELGAAPPDRSPLKAHRRCPGKRQGSLLLSLITSGRTPSNDSARSRNPSTLPRRHGSPRSPPRMIRSTLSAWEPCAVPPWTVAAFHRRIAEKAGGIDARAESDHIGAALRVRMRRHARAVAACSNRCRLRQPYSGSRHAGLRLIPVGGLRNTRHGAIQRLDPAGSLLTDRVVVTGGGSRRSGACRHLTPRQRPPTPPVGCGPSTAPPMASRSAPYRA